MMNVRHRHASTEAGDRGSHPGRTHQGAHNRMAISMVLNHSDQNSVERKDQQQPLPVVRHESLSIRPHHVDVGRSPDRLRQHHHHLPYPLASTEQRHCPYASPPQMPRVEPAMQSPAPRPPRYRWAPEEHYFLWYHRVDLGWTWDRIEWKFRRHFSKGRSKSGLQSKFYRILDDHGIPKIREQNRGTHRRGSDVEYTAEVNFVDFSKLRYPWMLSEHRDRVW